MFYIVFVEAAVERDRYMDPYEAKEFGLVDIVLERPAVAKKKAVKQN